MEQSLKLEASAVSLSKQNQVVDRQQSSKQQTKSQDQQNSPCQYYNQISQRYDNFCKDEMVRIQKQEESNRTPTFNQSNTEKGYIQQSDIPIKCERVVCEQNGYSKDEQLQQQIIRQEEKILQGQILDFDEPTNGQRISKPKRAPNSYLLFRGQIRHKLFQSQPKLRQAQVNQKAAELWRNLPQQEKNKYKQMSSKLKQKYQTQLKIYQSQKITEKDQTQMSTLQKKLKKKEMSLKKKKCKKISMILKNLKRRIMNSQNEDQNESDHQQGKTNRKRLPSQDLASLQAQINKINKKQAAIARMRKRVKGQQRQSSLYQNGYHYDFSSRQTPIQKIQKVLQGMIRPPGKKQTEEFDPSIKSIKKLFDQNSKAQQKSKRKQGRPKKLDKQLPQLNSINAQNAAAPKKFYNSYHESQQKNQETENEGRKKNRIPGQNQINYIIQRIKKNKEFAQNSQNSNKLSKAQESKNSVEDFSNFRKKQQALFEDFCRDFLIISDDSNQNKEHKKQATCEQAENKKIPENKQMQEKSLKVQNNGDKQQKVNLESAINQLNQSSRKGLTKGEIFEDLSIKDYLLWDQS